MACDATRKHEGPRTPLHRTPLGSDAGAEKASPRFPARTQDAEGRTRTASAGHTRRPGCDDPKPPWRRHRVSGPRCRSGHPPKETTRTSSETRERLPHRGQEFGSGPPPLRPAGCEAHTADGAEGPAKRPDCRKPPDLRAELRQRRADSRPRAGKLHTRPDERVQPTRRLENVPACACVRKMDPVSSLPWLPPWTLHCTALACRCRLQEPLNVASFHRKADGRSGTVQQDAAAGLVVKRDLEDLFTQHLSVEPLAEVGNELLGVGEGQDAGLPVTVFG